MANLTKVIAAYECCKKDDRDKCISCPYGLPLGDKTISCQWKDLFDDTLTLLKKKQARLMTEDDFAYNPQLGENGLLPAWVEHRQINGVAHNADGWQVINREWVTGYWDRRFWTSIPTEKQRKETPWDE